MIQVSRIAQLRSWVRHVADSVSNQNSGNPWYRRVAFFAGLTKASERDVNVLLAQTDALKVGSRGLDREHRLVSTSLSS